MTYPYELEIHRPGTKLIRTTIHARTLEAAMREAIDKHPRAVCVVEVNPQEVIHG